MLKIGSHMIVHVLILCGVYQKLHCYMYDIINSGIYTDQYTTLCSVYVLMSILCVCVGCGSISKIYLENLEEASCIGQSQTC